MKLDYTVIESIHQVMKERGKSSSFTKAFIKWIEEEGERNLSENDQFQRIDLLRDYIDENESA